MVLSYQPICFIYKHWKEHNKLNILNIKQNGLMGRLKIQGLSTTIVTTKCDKKMLECEKIRVTILILSILWFNEGSELGTLLPNAFIEVSGR